MYWMSSAACRTPKVRNAPKCSDVSTALKPTTGMLAAEQVSAVHSAVATSILRCLAQPPQQGRLTRCTARMEGNGTTLCSRARMSSYLTGPEQSWALKHVDHAPASRVPMMMNGAKAMYSRVLRRPVKMQAKQWMGIRLITKL